MTQLKITDSEGKILIPLYHGTSSIFLPMIEEYGLGGINLVEHFELDVVLEQLCQYFEDEERPSNWWEINKHTCRNMLKNKVTSGNFNFNYDGLYVTPSNETAKNYARSNKFGSEYLSVLMQAYEEVKNLSPIDADKILPSKHFIFQIINSDPKPILITITNLHKKDLETETGKDLDEQIEQMENIHQELWQQFNFSISRTLPLEDLMIDYVSDD